MGRVENNPIDNDKGESLADGWLKIASEVPLSSNVPIKPLEKPELEKPLTLAEIRQIHIDYLSGIYKPSSEEWDLISTDKNFYESDEYNTYKKQEIDKISAERTDIYAPSDEKIRLTIEPFIKLIERDAQKLLEVGSKLENELSEDNFFEVMKFFTDKYGIQDVPSLILTHEDSVNGRYSPSHNRIKLKIKKTNSIAEYIQTIVHEVWHAHQHQCESENDNYRINNEYYYKSSMDYDAYKNQLVEKEAFAIDNAIGDLYRRVDLKMHPEKIPALTKKYFEWTYGKYVPSRTEDGIDAKYLVLVYNEFSGLNYIKNSLVNRFRKVFRKEKK